MAYADDLLALVYPHTIQAVREGFDFKAFLETADRLGVPKQMLADIIGTPERTMRRRRPARLTKIESERLFRVLRVFRQVVEMFNNNESKARRWITSPAIALRGETPLNYCDTDLGADEVLSVIYRIEHGLYM